MYYLTDIDLEEVVVSTNDGIYFMWDLLESNSNINSIFFVRYSPHGGIGLFTRKVFYI